MTDIQQSAHNGNLDNRHINDGLHATVELEPDYHTWDENKRFVYISGGYGDCESSAITLDPKQALSLLAWLQQEEEALKKLAEGHENG